MLSVFFFFFLIISTPSVRLNYSRRTSVHNNIFPHTKQPSIPLLLGILLYGVGVSMNHPILYYYDRWVYAKIVNNPHPRQNA